MRLLLAALIAYSPNVRLSSGSWRLQSPDFNLDFYTEVQDLSYLESLLSQRTPRYAALNMAICSLIEETPLVGFETLAVEVSLRTLCPHFHAPCSWPPVKAPAVK